MKIKNEASLIASLPTRRQYTNHELVAGMTNRIPHISAAFFDLYGESINQLVWKLLRSEEDHDDVVQETLVTIMKSIKGIKDPSCLPKWVATVTIYTVRSEIRKRQLRRRFFMDVDHPESHLPPEPARPGDITGRVITIVRTMKPKRQIVFIMRYLEGFTFNEIAELHECSLSTIKRRGRRAKAEFLKKAARDLVLAAHIEEIDENECV